MKKVFLTFGDGGERYVAACRRLTEEARRTGQFDEVLGCNWGDVTEETLSSPLRVLKRGGGYWLWKADLVWQTLSRLTDGDILVWCDAGNVIYPCRRQWRRLFSLLDDVEMVVPKIFACGLNWHRKELLELFGADIPGGCKMCYQFEATVLVIRKTERTYRLAQEWRTFILRHPECVRDVETDSERAAQLAGYFENRADQSILTMLVYKYMSLGCSIRACWDFHLGLNVFGRPAILVARNKSGSAHRMSLAFRLRRAVERIVWAVQDRLERRGIRICWLHV